MCECKSCVLRRALELLRQLMVAITNVPLDALNSEQQLLIELNAQNSRFLIDHRADTAAVLCTGGTDS